MAGPTISDRLLELERIVPRVEKQSEVTGNGLITLTHAHQQTVTKMYEMQLKYETTITLLQREIEDLKRHNEIAKKDREEWDRRRWAFAPNIAGSVVTVLLSALVSYIISRR